MIDTTKVKERRKLQFGTIDDCLQELGRLEQAERQGNPVSYTHLTLPTKA